MNEIYKRLSDIHPKNRPAYVVIVMLIALVALYVTQIIPLQNEIADKRDKERLIRQELEDGKKVIDRIRKAQADIETEKDRSIRLAGQLPKDADISSLLRKMHSRVEESKIKINRVEGQKKIVQELFVRLEDKIEFTGSFESILQFITDLSDVKVIGRIINIEELELLRSPSATNKEIKGSFVLVTFMSKAGLKEGSK
jgi:Tfp pilus assembly protein PilO